MAGRSLGTLTLDLIAKTGGFESGMDRAARVADKKTREIERQAKERARAIETAFTGIAGKIAGAFAGIQAAQFISQTIDLQGRLDDLSKSTGISATNLAGLDHAARQSGSNLDTVASAVNKLAVNMGKDGEKFARLGVTASEPIEAFAQLADVLNGIEDPQKRAAVAAEALGKNWQELAPLLSEGSAGIRELTDEGRTLSGVTEETNQRAAAFGDNLEKLKTGAYGLANSIINPLLPALNDLIAKFNEAAKAKTMFAWATTSGSEEDNAAAELETIAAKLEKLRTMRDELSKPTITNKINDFVFGDVHDLDKQIGYLESKQAYLQGIAALQKKTEAPATPTPTTTPTSAVSAFLASSEKPNRTREAISDTQRLIEQLQQRLQTAQHLSEVEKLQIDLATKKYSTATPGERDILESLAAQLDTHATIGKQLDSELATVAEITDQYKEQESRLKRLIEATPFGQNMQQMQDEALLDSALSSGKIDQTVYDQAIAKLREVKDEGKNAFSELQDAIDGWGKQSAGAITDFCFGTKTSFSDMVTSMLKDLSTMVIQQNVTGPLAKSIGTWATSLFTANADGGVYSSPGLSAYSGQIVSTPTLFPFAKGVGLMGEAGPEAILPLQRGSDGKMGVTMNGGGSGDTVVNVTVNHTGDTKKESTEGGNSALKALGNQIKNVVLDVITTERRPGGLLYA